MRVIICPDKFAGTLSAPEAAEAIGAGWLSVRPGDSVLTRPLADGGPGFLDVLAERGGRRLAVDTVDPLGRPVRAEILVTGETAYVESAQSCGLHLLRPEERAPGLASSSGLGRVLREVPVGVRTIVVGLGGSGTNDGGAGLLAELGGTPVDAAGQPCAPGGFGLLSCIGLSGQPVAPYGAVLVAATDVDNPLTGPYGASRVFGPQKGASADDVRRLDEALARYARVLTNEVRTCPPGLADLPGAGAAGGLGAAILALGGRCESGVRLVFAHLGLAAALDDADLVLTGEGSFDQQSLRGKVVSGVAEAARDRGLPCLVLAGRVTAGRREAAAAGVTGAYSLVEHLGGVDEAMARAAEGLTSLAARLAGQWTHGRFLDSFQKT